MNYQPTIVLPVTNRWTIPLALEIKEELDKIEELLNQLEQARENAQIAILDLDQLTEFMDSETMQSLEEMQRSIENYLREMAERQGLTRENGKFQLTPQAYRIFQNKLLGRIFGELKSSRSGRHATDVPGDGAVELQQTKPYEFGDSITHMDIPQTFVNAMLRSGARLPLQLKTEDIEIHTTRNNPKCATVVLMDMSGSMRYDGQYMNVKRMALAMDGLIRTEYPGDVVHFVEMYTFGKVRKQGEIVDLMPKPVTLHDPRVQLKVDMGDPDVSEHMVHQHFTNIQHALKLARQLLAAQNTPNRQILLITDGLPTAHFEDSTLYMLYPPASQDGRNDDAGRNAVRAGRDHDQYVPGPQLVSIRRGHSVRLPFVRSDLRQGVFHSWQRLGPVRCLGLLETQTGDSLARPPTGLLT